MVLKLLEKEPDDLFLNFVLGLEFAAELQTDDAERQFMKVLTLDSNYIAAYYQLGKLLESNGKVKDALIYFREGLSKAREQNNNKSANEFEEAIFTIED